ncbi:hypothetical protein ABZ508_09695 [Streptomyces lavendulocolor]|uniref:Uncharacterized protein n=1 Tax=Streptomyces lavendulocolor TaxID=67316 RepID=A0ABV2W278_9ACTN
MLESLGGGAVEGGWAARVNTRASDGVIVQSEPESGALGLNPRAQGRAATHGTH